MRAAPSEGPGATASAPMPPHRATIWDRYSLEYEPRRSDSDAGRTEAAPNPWTTRPIMSVGTEGAMAQSKEPKEQMARPKKKTRRAPRRSALLPATTSNEPKMMA